jgi:inner membrane protein
MASLAHVAVGVIAARADGRKRAWLPYVALSMLPDADVITFAMGIPYADAFGHRGASHSLFVAIVLGLLIGLFDRRWRTALLAGLVIASHGLLDTLTDGGLGAALFWPFSDLRYFAPWQPIPVAPIGLAFISPRGLWCLFVEALLTAPLWIWIGYVWRRDRRVSDLSQT